jgi:two-component system OmpR family response regulator
MATKDRVMVVDDDRDARETLAAALMQSGYMVQVATDGRDALARMSSSPADLVVSDVCLPGMSGVELLAALRQGGYEQPVVLITGLDRDMAAAAHKYGAAACLRKPMALDELLWAVDCALACRPTPVGHAPTQRNRVQLRFARQ